ncbi:MAG: hypothetical protein AAFP19_10355, partial [Bacteroidota bacterium]
RGKIGDYLKQMALSDFHYEVTYTAGFKHGLSPVDYGQKLMDSQIAFIPEGTYSPVSFRFFEAARCGNVMISCTLPNTWYYRPFPGIQLSTWDQLPEVLPELLARPERLHQLHTQTLAYYRHYLSPQVTARYMLHAIRQKLPQKTQEEPWGRKSYFQKAST